jgi:subtilisin family serine protease
MWGPQHAPELGETTGRFLVLLPDTDRKKGIEALQETVPTLTLTSDLGAEALNADISHAPGVVFEKLGVAVVEAEPEQMQSLSVSAEPKGGDMLAIEPERVVYALERTPITSADLPSRPAATAASGLSSEYLRGYRDAVVHLAEAGGVNGGTASALAAVPVDEHQVTWGLQATAVPQSAYTGNGIKVAILDTGFDLNHPDFVGRAVQGQTFVAGAQLQDVVGHGTHCIGTACGPRDPGVLPRYGVAHGADIHAGKVLNDQGRGVDGDILAGIEWAIASGCQVVSMSLGAPVRVGDAYSRVFERAARRALRAGTLIVAAAGNDSRRDLGQVRPVSHPANCPSILAVAAVDQGLAPAYFSNGGTSAAGGRLDLAGPGVDVRSSWPMPARYNTISGTSMATPHVAGIAALAAEADAANRGAALWSFLQRGARRLPQSSTDVGTGLVQAP